MLTPARLVLALLAASALGACAAPGAPTALRLTPVVKATAARPAATKAAGQLQVRVAGWQGYRTLATGLDVVALRLTLTTSLPTFAPVTRTLKRAALAEAGGVVRFDGLPTGAASLAVEALGAHGAVIGQGAQAAKIVRGQTTRVAIGVKLERDLPQPAAGALEAAIAFETDVSGTWKLSDSQGAALIDADLNHPSLCYARTYVLAQKGDAVTGTSQPAAGGAPPAFTEVETLVGSLVAGQLTLEGTIERFGVDPDLAFRMPPAAAVRYTLRFDDDLNLVGSQDGRRVRLLPAADEGGCYQLP